MRVAIEAATLGMTSGGLARYTCELSLALARGYPEDEYFLISDQPFRMPPGAPLNLKRGGGPRNLVERRWWLWGIGCEMKRLGAALIHGPDFAVPYLSRRPSVLTIHDLSPWMDPAWHSNSGRVARRTPVLLETGRATMVLTPSEKVRKQAIERFRLAPNRVVAAPEAAADWFRPCEAAPAPPYFLFLGTVEPRKNVPALIQAWRETRAVHGAELVVAGRRRADGPDIAPEPGLRVLGEVPDSQLPELYSGALAFVYPSLYEGFGLPVLEAMQCGACVIASHAVDEIAGDAAAYADDVPSLGRAMIQAATDAGWRAAYRERALARARQFSWEAAARITHEVYLEACERFSC